jgi:hypothetical protein
MILVYKRYLVRRHDRSRQGAVSIGGLTLFEDKRLNEAGGCRSENESSLEKKTCATAGYCT